MVIVGLIVVFGWLLVALFAEILAPVDPYFQDLAVRKIEPNAEHRFGTDALGRDIFSRVLHGTRITIPAGVAVIIFSSILGTFVGSISGYLGGIWDEFFMRLTELREAGVTAATVSRMERDGDVIRLARGVYQLADADLDPHHGLAVAAKRIPKGVVCLVSALAFHGLTDQLPPPKSDIAGIRIVRFANSLLDQGVEEHTIEGVPVKVFSAARAVVDCFRHRSKVGLTVAIEGLREALRQGRATPAEIARQADVGGVSTVIRPYLEALPAHV